MNSESLFHTQCYQNRVNVCPQKLNFLVWHKDQGEAPSKFQETTLLTKKKQQNRVQKHFPRGGKMLATSYPGWHLPPPCHPMAMGLLMT